MGLFEHWPYVNFHDLNLDWIIKEIPKVFASRDEAQASAEASAESAEASQQSAEASQQSAEASQQSAEASQQSAEDSQESADDSQQSAEEAAQVVSDTRNQVSLLQSRVDNIIPDGTQTAGNTELLDIRVAFNSVRYDSAGDSVRGQASILNNKINLINDTIGITYDEITPIDGYSADNGGATLITNAPFIYGYQNIPDLENCVIKEITLDVITAGVLTIGTVKRVDTQVTNFDRDNLIIKDVITVTNTGYQHISLLNQFTVPNDEYLFIGNNTDTVVWKYGSSGESKGFIYINSTGGNAFPSGSLNSMGINVIADKIEKETLRASIKSTYDGKTISILGDSISTFAGYIPAGNATYYPSGTVTTVDDTWWKKLIDAMGMTLNVNNSWSGSRVTTTGGEASAGCGTRAESLGTNPDVIIVWMGINDFNNEVQIGTYNGETAIPETTTTFREAYAIMLNKVLTTYPSAEVWCCTLPQCERNAETGFPEINGNGVTLNQFNIAIEEIAHAMNVKVLDHARSGLTYQNMPVFNPDNLHPNKFGHSLVANNDIRQMDNAVSTRYETA